MAATAIVAGFRRRCWLSARAAEGVDGHGLAVAVELLEHPVVVIDFVVEVFDATGQGFHRGRVRRWSMARCGASRTLVQRATSFGRETAQLSAKSSSAVTTSAFSSVTGRAGPHRRGVITVSTRLASRIPAWARGSGEPFPSERFPAGPDRVEATINQINAIPANRIR